MPSMDLRRLREETRPEHEATEALMPLTAPGLTLATYTEVLRLLLPVLRGWEAWAAHFAPPALRPLLAARRRSHWIEQDLLALGDSRRAFEASLDEPVPWSAVIGADARNGGSGASGSAFEAAFLGALYVMEGSTLGGRYIARHVEEALRIEPGQGDAYFRGHEEQTGALWRETTATLAAVPDELTEIVIAAAKRTFGAFGAVLGTRQAPAAGFAANN